MEVAADAARRPEVIDALARQSERVIDAVAAMLTEPRAAARFTAVEVLARMRHPRASAALAQALRDSDSAVRTAAVSGFGRLGTPAVAAKVVELRDNDPDPAVRRKAAIVCQRYGWER
jgi:HEAT repeat protein